MRDIMEWVYGVMQTKLGNSVKIVIGSLPSAEGVSIAPSTGAPVSVTVNKQRLNRTTYVINAKSASQVTAIGWLEDIHTALNNRLGYGSDDYWQITDIRTSNEPTYLGQEGNEWYLYGSSIQVTWYYHKSS